MPGFAAGGTAEQEQNKRYTMKSIKYFCSCFLLLFKEEMTERVKKSSPNSTSVFTSKKGILQKNQIKTVNIGTAAKFDFIQGEAGKYFPDFVCKHPSRWTANTPKWPLGEFFLTSFFLHPRKKNSKTPADTSFLLIFFVPIFRISLKSNWSSVQSLHF